MSKDVYDASGKYLGQQYPDGSVYGPDGVKLGEVEEAIGTGPQVYSDTGPPSAPKI